MQDLTQINKDFLKVKRRLFDKYYGARLNPEQCRAVFTAEGPLLCLAGAGSGKTTVLVNRICYLIKYGDAYNTDFIPEGVNGDTVEMLNLAYGLEGEDLAEILSQFAYQPAAPWSVLAITFTNKAAREIKDRLLTAFGNKEVSDAIWAGTFHSVCLRILRKYGDRLGYREGLSIYGTDDKKRMILDCMERLEIDEKRLSHKVVANAISMAKDNLKSADEFEITGDPRSKDIKRIYELYQERMMKYNAVDFDDIIMRTVELLLSDREVREYYQHKFKYILVDEYQDTNYAQFVLTKILADGYRNIMVVGDDDQSIYRFRGATIENILNFDTTYPDATVVKLEQNYRSTGNILAAANAIISNNSDRHEKRLWCDKGDGEKITVKEAEDQNDEGRYIVDRIAKGVVSGKRRYSDYAVLYRLNALGRSLQTSFTKSGIPYRVVGDMGFYDRKEVKDMIAYLSLVASSGDSLRLKRIINEPKRKIGPTTVDAIEEIAAAVGISMYDVMRRVDEFPVLSKSAAKIKDFVSLIESVGCRGELPSQMIKDLFERSGYYDMLKAEGFEGEGRIENVNEFIAAAMEYEKRISDLDGIPTLPGFLEEVFLVSDVDKYDENSDAVVLMTIHAAKGLEFPVVFLAGMEDGLFPSETNMTDPEQMSEERRLAYVALTRAKEKLYVTYAKNRMLYGRTVYGTLSCFVREEVPENLTEREESRRGTWGQRDNFYGSRRTPRERGGYSELHRSPEISSSAPAKRATGGYEIEKFPAGTRVCHSIFGNGIIKSTKDMGGDMLYEVEFDSGQTRKLMATYAKMTRIK